MKSDVGAAGPRVAISSSLKMTTRSHSRRNAGATSADLSPKKLIPYVEVPPLRAKGKLAFDGVLVPPIPPHAGRRVFDGVEVIVHHAAKSQ